MPLNQHFKMANYKDGYSEKKVSALKNTAVAVGGLPWSSILQLKGVEQVGASASVEESEVTAVSEHVEQTAY